MSVRGVKRAVKRSCVQANRRVAAAKVYAKRPRVFGSARSRRIVVRQRVSYSVKRAALVLDKRARAQYQPFLWTR